jgi:hypothetical protein
MSVPLTAAGDVLGLCFALLLFVLLLVYIGLRSRGTFGDLSGRSLR